LNTLIDGSPQNDTDPIRNMASKFISEDTTYYPYKANIEATGNLTSFIGDRVLRWEFAYQIFRKEYTLKQKIFGGGFNFLNWYGYYFLHDKTQSDWPHNPFLSILLYSGIIGLLIYCFFIYKVFFYYLRYRKEYPLLFIFFLITFFFTFFSGGSPFDPPIMGFFVILPFFIHSIHKKDISLNAKLKILDE
jgi:O-antigen ligase